ncbi:respiratory nitrate reductase subunit alpha [Klebsiella pneumoniae]|uniref:Respiratory nitrate reductase subunit alpha n=1 Tax=Klebsiella pneumoniae TaxID=573 RepID=A0A377W4A1_KLEPN|nr:respiratory nitrate reductase subunit alpha [Klebsiella pneumoniae]
MTTAPPATMSESYTPAWAEKITGVSRAHIIRTAREFADNADKITVVR